MKGGTNYLCSPHKEDANESLYTGPSDGLEVKFLLVPPHCIRKKYT